MEKLWLFQSTFGLKLVLKENPGTMPLPRYRLFKEQDDSPLQWSHCSLRRAFLGHEPDTVTSHGGKDHNYLLIAT
jgi:hypothetical protein